MVKSKTFEKVASVILAIVLWGYVVNVVNPPSTTVISDVPVLLQNQGTLDSKGLAIAGSGQYTVDVVLAGSRTDLIGITVDNITATADLIGLTAGQNYLTVNVLAPSETTVTEIRTEKIQVFVDELITMAKPVVVKATNMANGYEIGAVKTNMDTIDVTGAKIVVDGVSSVLVTVDADQLSVDEIKTEELSAKAVDEQLNEVVGVHLSQNKVTLTGMIYSTKPVALEVPVEGQTGVGTEIKSADIPGTIVIKGPRDELAAVEAVVAKPVIIQGITEDTTIPIEPILSGSIEMASISKGIAAVFTLQDVDEVSFIYSGSDVWLVNLDSKYDAVIEEETVKVTAKGEAGVVSVLQASELQPAVDLKDLGVGTHDVMLKGRYNQQLVLINMEPYSVKVKITEKNASVEAD